jgi:hypothetical protein
LLDWPGAWPKTKPDDKRALPRRLAPGLQQEEQQQRAPANLAGLGAILLAIQQSARAAGLDKMTKRQINAEIAAARKDMQARKPANKRGR